MIVNKEFYSAQNYIELATGKCYIIDGDNDVESIRHLLKLDKKKIKDYDFQDTSFIEEGVDVVLVDCLVWDESKDEYLHELHWFEVPKDAIKKGGE